MDALAHFSKCALADSFTYEIISNEAIVHSFLATLSGLPVTLFSFLLLELRQRLAERGLQALTLSHLRYLRAFLGHAARPARLRIRSGNNLASLCLSLAPILNSICH